MRIVFLFLVSNTITNTASIEKCVEIQYLFRFKEEECFTFEAANQEKM